jgi:hypothetical protein
MLSLSLTVTEGAPGRFVRVAWIAIVALVLALPAGAGDWQPNPGVKNELIAPVEQPSAATSSENQWVETLIRNLKRGGANPAFVHRFSSSSAEYRVNGERREGVVFIYRDEPDVFLIASSDASFAEFVINFKGHSVDSVSFGTIYIPPSRRFCVVVFDRDYSLRGIPVAGSADNPSFRDRVASWY